MNASVYALGRGVMANIAVSEARTNSNSTPRRDDNDRRATTSKPARFRIDISQYRTRWAAKLVPLLFGGAAIAILWIDWRYRDDNGLTPENGIGYWLGIVGSSLMLLLLLYPLRKRTKTLRAIGSVGFWFRAHMVLGVFGPVLVILHSNFRLGSINSNVALATMLIVSASGIVGRYLYGKIHVGLYGRKAEVREILADADALKRAIGADLPISDRILEELSTFAKLGAIAPTGLLGGFLTVPVVSVRASMVRARLIAEARQIIAIEGRRHGWSGRVQKRRLAPVAELLTLYIAAIKRAAAFTFFERLFRLWHIFHLPLFFLLVLAAIVHVFAEHFF